MDSGHQNGLPSFLFLTPLTCIVYRVYVKADGVAMRRPCTVWRERVWREAVSSTSIHTNIHTYMQDVCPCHLYYWHVEVLSWSTRFFFITYVCDRMDNYIASRARSQFMLLKVDRMVGVPEGCASGLRPTLETWFLLLFSHHYSALH